MATIIVDANVIVSAIMGRSLPLVLEIAVAAVLITPTPMIAEAQHTIARMRGHEAARQVETLLELIAPVEPFAFGQLEAEARGRLGAGGQSDWPVLATALAFRADIWSRDVDFFGTGVAVWSTRNIRRAIGTSANRDDGAINA